MTNIQEWFKEREELYKKLSIDDVLRSQIQEAAGIVKKVLNAGGKILIFGNGGSAAEAQHFAAELVGRFEKDRAALPAIALTTDTSIITAQANDDSFGTIFSRQIEALGKKEDVIIGMTTSDAAQSDMHSQNILNAFNVAKEKGIKSLGLFSDKTKSLLELVDVPIIINNTQTALIQEAHLSVIHLLCRFIESE